MKIKYAVLLMPLISFMAYSQTRTLRFENNSENYELTGIPKKIMIFPDENTFLIEINRDSLLYGYSIDSNGVFYLSFNPFNIDCCEDEKVNPKKLYLFDFKEIGREEVIIFCSPNKSRAIVYEYSESID